MFIAEREGFEPPEVLPSTVFKTAAIDHSAISPKKFFPLPRLGFCVAERTRFELVVGLLLRQFSKLVVSATHPPLQCLPNGFCVCKVRAKNQSSKIFTNFLTTKFLQKNLYNTQSIATEHVTKINLLTSSVRLYLEEVPQHAYPHFQDETPHQPQLPMQRQKISRPAHPQP